MAEEHKMAGFRSEGWESFSVSSERFRRIAEDFAVAIDDGINGRPSSLQMLPTFVGRPSGRETGVFHALDFGGTNLRVAEVELLGQGGAVIRKVNRMSLKRAADGNDYTASDVDVGQLFDFIARQIAPLSDGRPSYLGHSFSYASRQSSLGRAKLTGWTKEIKVKGLEGQDINELLHAALVRQHCGNIRPVAVINDTTATLLAAAYSKPAADLGSVCGTGHNTCYYENQPRHGGSGAVMAYNAESGGFDNLPFCALDDALDAASEQPGSQRLEKMVSGRYLGELARRLIWSGRGPGGLNFLENVPAFSEPDGLTSVDVACFVGDMTDDLQMIDRWFVRHLPGVSISLPARQFIKAAAEMVSGRAATLIAASYAGFLLRMDPNRGKRHLIGINGSLYEKMPGFAAGIQTALAVHGGWGPEKVEFQVIDEAPVIGAAVAAAMVKEGEAA